MHKQALAFDYVKKNFTSKGMIADMNFHGLDSDNPHVQIFYPLLIENAPAFVWVHFQSVIVKRLHPFVFT